MSLESETALLWKVKVCVESKCVCRKWMCVESECVCVEMNVYGCVESECKCVERESVLESECVWKVKVCVCRK